MMQHCLAFATRWLTHIQRARGKHVWFVGILEEKVDDFNRLHFVLQIDGNKTGLELPGIVDEVITLAEYTPEGSEESLHQEAGLAYSVQLAQPPIWFRQQRGVRPFIPLIESRCSGAVWTRRCWRR